MTENQEDVGSIPTAGTGSGHNRNLINPFINKSENKKVKGVHLISLSGVRRRWVSGLNQFPAKESCLRAPLVRIQLAALKTYAQQNYAKTRVKI